MSKLTHQDICAACVGTEEGRSVCNEGAPSLALFLLGKPYTIHRKCKRALEHLTLKTTGDKHAPFED